MCFVGVGKHLVAQSTNVSLTATLEQCLLLGGVFFRRHYSFILLTGRKHISKTNCQPSENMIAVVYFVET